MYGMFNRLPERKKIKEENLDNEGWVGVIAIKIFASVTSILVITTNTVYLVQKLINPEYYALRTVLRYIN